MELKLPCIDCITLAICKQEILERERNNYLYILIPLTMKCFLLREYVFYSELIEDDNERCMRLKNPEPIISLFNLKRNKIEII